MSTATPTLTDADVERIAQRTVELIAARTDRRRVRRYTTKSEAAKLLGVDRKTVERWCKCGRLLTTSAGVDRESLETLLIESRSRGV